ncbi:restriction endonuclease subunit S [Archangium gephyra]|uniref:restriction endonuclease subunit S n=1 Tax=Archangium gephyra TaxID=48 RepID=UPI003B7AF37C
MSNPGLPSNWSVVPLGRIVAPTRPRILPSELPELPYVGMEHVEAHSMRLLGTVPAGTMKSSGVRFHRGDILYGRLRPYLNKVWLANVDGLCSAEFIVLPPSAALESRYLSYLLNSADFVSFASHLNEGDRPRVDFDQLAQFPVPVPPRLEQARIAEEIEKQFTRLDAGVAALKRVQAQLKRYRASVLKAACEGRLVPTEAELARREKRDYAPADKLLARILKERRGRWEADQLAMMKAAGKPPKGNDTKTGLAKPTSADVSSRPTLPDGWAWARMEDLSIAGRGGIFAGPFGTIFKARDFRDEGIPIIFLRHVAPGRYLTHKPGFMDRKIWEERFRDEYSVWGGELLVTKLGEPPGVAALFPSTLGPAMVTPDVIAMRADDRLVLPKFLMHFLNSDSARSVASGLAFGTTRLRLTIPLFREIWVPLPPLAEQGRIVAEIDAQLSVADAAGAAVVKNLALAAQLRSAVLAHAFAGKLMPQEATDEPASKLLERISASVENKSVPKQGRAKQTTAVPKMKATR